MKTGSAISAKERPDEAPNDEKTGSEMKAARVEAAAAVAAAVAAGNFHCTKAERVMQPGRGIDFASVWCGERASESVCSVCDG